MEVTGLNKKNIVAQYLPLLGLALFVLLFIPTIQELYERWIKWDEGLSHGLLVNSVFIYLLYKTLPWPYQPNTRRTNLALLIMLAACSLGWLLFRLANIYIFEELLLLPMLLGLYGASFGLKTLLRFRLLLVLPIFTIPIWEQLTDTLVNLSGVAVGTMVEFIKIPAIIKGNSIFIPYGHIVIADGCSGLRYLEIALALAFIIGLLNHYDEKRMLPTLLIAAALGLLANWIRIFVLVLIGYHTRMQSPLMANHEYFGWILFGFMCIPAIYFAPVIKITPIKTHLNDSYSPKLLTPIMGLALGPILGYFINTQPAVTPLHTQLDFNQSAILPVTVTAPANAFSERGQLTNGTYVEIDQYQRIDQKDKLVPYIARLYNNEDWLADKTYTTVENHSATLTHFRHKTSSIEALQLQWFDVGGHITASLAMAKILQIPAMLKGVNNFKIITLQVHCDLNDCSAAKASLLASPRLIPHQVIDKP